MVAGCCHTFYAAGITAEPRKRDIIERPQTMGAHQSPRASTLHGWPQGDIPLDVIEHVVI